LESMLLICDKVWLLMHENWHHSSILCFRFAKSGR